MMAGGVFIGGVAMLTSSALISSLFRDSLRVACCLLLFCSSIRGQERPPDSTGKETTELAALKVLNDSDLARTVKPTLQDTRCTYQNPAFPDLYPKEKAATLDTMSPAVPPDPVRADDSEYLIRFQSARPVQTAVEELLALGDKWSAYGVGKRQVSQDDAPTDLSNARYNVADMITIAVILKRLGSDGMTLFDYGFEENGRKFPSRSFLVFPCAGLRTGNGQVFARVVPTTWHNNNTKALQLSFPRLIDGKPLISNVHEKVEFRLVVNQRVFEATFYVNASDVLDGSEKVLYLPSTFITAEELAQQ
jgi:hypothetical protein